MTANGKNGDRLRNDLQFKLGFTDTDYAPIRAASQELAAELAPIKKQINSFNSSPSNGREMRSLVAQRDADIASEVNKLRQELSPQDAKAFEAFLVKFFAPRPPLSKVATYSVQPAGREVQK